jgi:hypothetical protein
MKILLFIILLIVSTITSAQNACACIFYEEGVLVDCQSGNCSQGRYTNCINQGGVWYNGSGQVPAGMTACDVVLPIRLSIFTGFNVGCENIITWSTESEQNNDFFTLEHSSDGKNWRDIVYVPGAGNSSSSLSYEYQHKGYTNEINYYRLRQTDYDGTTEIFNIISIDNRNNKYLVKMINIMGQEVDDNYTGIVIYQYSDGTFEKKYINN